MSIADLKYLAKGSGEESKRSASDAQFQEKHNEIQGMIENLHDQLTAVPKDQRNTPDYLKMQDQLSQAIQDRNAHWKSVDQPNALMKFGKMLGKDLRFKKQEAPVPVAPPVYGQSTMQTPEYTDELGINVPASTAVPTGPAYKVQGPQTPAQVKAAAEAAQLVAAGPVSPEQTAVGDAQAKAAGSLATMQATLKNLKTLFPDASPEQMKTWQTELVQSMTGGKSVAEKYFSQPMTTKDSDGKEHYWRVPMDPNLQPEEIDFNGQTVVPKNTQKPSSAMEAQAIRARYGMDLEKLSPEQASEAIAWYRQQNTPETTSTGQTLVYDQNNQPHVFTHTGTSTKSFPGSKGSSAIPPSSGNSGASRTMAVPNPKGLVEQGNIPIWNRPTVQNSDGSHSSEYSTSFDQDGKEVLVPTVVNGKFLTPDGKKPKEGSPEEKAMFKAAWDHYLKTGENLGKFDNPNDADAYAKILHNRGNKANLSEVKKEAAKLNPQASSGSAQKNSKSPIGPALDFKKMTPEVAAANKKYNDAVALEDFADKVQKHPNNAQEQRDFAIMMERTMSGRFQTAAYDLEVKNSGIANTFQQWMNDVSTGALPQKIVDNLVQSAHDYKDAMAKEVEAAKGKTPNAGGATPDAAAKSLADRLHEAYGAK